MGCAASAAFIYATLLQPKDSSFAAAKMQNAAPLAPVVVLIASPVHSQAKLQQSTSFARLENFGA